MHSQNVLNMVTMPCAHRSFTLVLHHQLSATVLYDNVLAYIHHSLLLADGN